MPMKNRYDGILRVHNQAITSLGSPLPVLWNVAGYELKRLNTNAHLLEIGCGEGNSIESILHLTEIKADLLDVSPKMIKIARRRLKKYNKRVQFITQDAYHYLQTSSPYDVIYSSFTIHNFKQNNKDNIFRAIYRSLKKKGIFLLHDLIPEGRDTRRFEIQINRYKYLPKLVARSIVAHVRKDMTDMFRMEEQKLLPRLRRAGFKEVYIIDRLDREALVIAKKS